MSLSLFINIDYRNSLETISSQLKFIKWVPAAVCCLGLGAVRSFGCKRLSNSRICKKSHWKGRRATLTTTPKFPAGQTSLVQECWIPWADPSSTEPSPQDEGRQTLVLSARSPCTTRLKHRVKPCHLHQHTLNPSLEKRNSNNHLPLTRTLFCHWESELLRKVPIWSCSITHRGICYNWALESKILHFTNWELGVTVTLFLYYNPFSFQELISASYIVSYFHWPIG